jgi:hypothetical protein
VVRNSACYLEVPLNSWMGRLTSVQLFKFTLTQLTLNVQICCCRAKLILKFSGLLKKWDGGYADEIVKQHFFKKMKTWKMRTAEKKWPLWICGNAVLQHHFWNKLRICS